MEEIKVTVIGTGALGSTFARALYENNIAVHSLYNRSKKSLTSLANQLNPEYTGEFPEEYHELGNLIFITTPDQQIAKTDEKLASLSDDFSGKAVAHCSGTKTSECLSALKTKGGYIASFHPVQTFTRKSKVSDFRGIYFDIEGDEEAKVLLSKIAKIFGAQTFKINEESKPFLHAAGVMASNYLLALLDTAAEIADIGGIKKKQAQKMLLPLASKTLENAMAENNISEVLSGPVARGDSATVAEHINLLKSNNSLVKIYKLLGTKTVDISMQKGSISRKEKDELIKLFVESSEDDQ